MSLSVKLWLWLARVFHWRYVEQFFKEIDGLQTDFKQGISRKKAEIKRGQP